MIDRENLILQFRLNSNPVYHRPYVLRSAVSRLDTHKTL